MVSDWKVKKVFVEVSVIVVLFSFVWFVDWTDRFILKEALGFSTFFKIGFCAKEFRFFRLGVHYDLRIFHSLAFGSIFQPPLISNSRETSVFSTYQNRIRSIRVLRTRMWTFIGFACGFRFWSNFFCSFAVVDDFFDSFEVSNRPSHPSVQWSSTRILALQIENLSF